MPLSLWTSPRSRLDLTTNSFLAQCPASFRKSHPATYPNVWYVPNRLATSSVLEWYIDGLSSLDALLEALSHLDDVCSTIEDRYRASLAGGQYERWQEKS